MKLWITACNDKRQVIFNEIIEGITVKQAHAIAESYVPIEYHGSICITDENNNEVAE